jgi:hypothetical protein
VEGNQLGPVTSDEEASALGAALAARVLDQGAATILAQARGVSAPRITEP